MFDLVENSQKHMKISEGLSTYCRRDQKFNKIELDPFLH